VVGAVRDGFGVRTATAAAALRGLVPMRRVGVLKRRPCKLGRPAAATALSRVLVPIAMFLDRIAVVAGAAAPARGGGLSVRADVRHVFAPLRSLRCRWLRNGERLPDKRHGEVLPHRGSRTLISINWLRGARPAEAHGPAFSGTVVEQRALLRHVPTDAAASAPRPVTIELCQRACAAVLPIVSSRVSRWLRLKPMRTVMTNDLPVRLFGVLGLAGALTFLLSLLVLQIVRSDVDWTVHYVSDFVNGALGWLFVISALAHGLGNLALTIGVRGSLEPGAPRAWASALLFVSAAGILLAALFPTDPAASVLTWVGLVHRTAVTVSFILELAALFLFSTAFARSSQWKPYAPQSLVLAIFAAGGLSIFFLVLVLDRLPGLGERVALASFVAWELWAAFRLIRFGPVGGTTDARPKASAT
jgi:hypothetical protein